MGLFEQFPYTNFHDLNLEALLRYMRDLIKLCKELDDLVGGYNDRIKALESFVKALEKGDLPEPMMDAIYAWLDKNIIDIVSHAIKQVWFGLTMDGHFVAYIPESWEEIQFATTGYDIEIDVQPDYGHLVLLARIGDIVEV